MRSLAILGVLLAVACGGASESASPGDGGEPGAAGASGSPVDEGEGGEASDGRTTDHPSSGGTPEGRGGATSVSRGGTGAGGRQPSAGGALGVGGVDTSDPDSDPCQDHWNGSLVWNSAIGACQECPPGWLDCDYDPSTGCETRQKLSGIFCLMM